MRGWTTGMSVKHWSGANSFLRHINDVSKSKTALSMDTQSPLELLLALDQIRKFVQLTNTGKAKIRIHLGMINISIESSREMS